MSLIEVIGWTGGLLLAVCAFPETLRTVMEGKCHIGWGTLLMWYFGEIFTLIYILTKARRWPIIFNYSFNILLVSVMIYYKF